MRATAKANPRSPHEVDVAWLVKKLIYIRALISDDRHAQFLVLERNASMAFNDHLSDSAAKVSVVMKRLIAHLQPSIVGSEDITRSALAVDSADLLE